MDSLRYPAIITREGGSTLVRFPDCPGCQTQADGHERIEDQAAEALAGWLEVVARKAPRYLRWPPKRAPKTKHGERVLWVTVPEEVAEKVRMGLFWHAPHRGPPLSVVMLGRAMQRLYDALGEKGV